MVSGLLYINTKIIGAGAVEGWNNVQEIQAVI
jgi:hypothetical protein